MHVRSFTILFSLLLLVEGCLELIPRQVIFKKGEFWADKFMNNNFPFKAYKDDKIYTNGFVSGVDDPCLFYCLDLKTGRVEWVANVNSRAGQSPIICDGFIYYCGYLGDIYKFDKNGNQIWKSEFNTTYGGHCINPISKNLLVSTVTYGLREIDFKTGRIVDSIGYGNMRVPLPTFKNDTIYQIINDTLFCHTFPNHSLVFQKIIGPNVWRIFIHDQLLYYFDMNSVCCLNSVDGMAQWRTNSVFKQPMANPHLEFEDGKLICYFDLDDMSIVNSRDGVVLQRTNYRELQRTGYLKPHVAHYKVSDSFKNKYEIKVMNTLIGPEDFRNQFEVAINKR